MRKNTVQTTVILTEFALKENAIVIMTLEESTVQNDDAQMIVVKMEYATY